MMRQGISEYKKCSYCEQSFTEQKVTVARNIYNELVFFCLSCAKIKEEIPI